MKLSQLFGLLIVAAVSLFSFGATAHAVTLADIAADYQDGAAGQTSDDIPITGSIAGSWHYLSDTNGNPLDGGLNLLTHQSVGLEGGDGYAGTGSVFNNCCGPFPIVSNDGLFDGITVPPVGHVAIHPGGSNPNNVPPEFLAIEYRAPAAGEVLRKMTVDMRLQNSTGGTGIDYNLLDNRGRVLTTGAVNNSVDNIAGLSIPTLRPGESTWLVVGNGAGDNPGGDQTFLQQAFSGETATLIADLATDYREGASGATSDSIGIDGTSSGRWSYFSDTDNDPTNGGLTLLTMQSVGLEGGDGFAGTGTVFNDCCGPFPIVSDDGLFDGVASPPPGSLAVHPGASVGTPPEFMVLQFEATSGLTNLVLTYEVENPNAGGDGIDFQILDDLGNLLVSGLLDGQTTGMIDLDLDDMSAGDHLFLVMGNGAGDNPGGDQSFVSLTLSGDQIVPEPASATLCLLGLGGLIARRRRSA